MLCRICIINSDDFLDIFSNDGKELGIADILELHLFKPQPDDNPSTVICSNCWSKVIDFHEFYITIEETQFNFIDGINVKPEASPSIVYSSCEFVDPDDDNTKEEIIGVEFEVGGNIDEEIESVSTLNHLSEVDDDQNEELCDVEAQAFSSTRRKWKRKCVNETSTNEKLKRNKQTEIVDIEPTENVQVENNSPEDTHCIRTKEEDDEMMKKYIKMVCDLCTYVGDDHLSIRRHFQTQHPNFKPYVRCCKKKLFDRINMVEHAYRHEDPEYFKCNICQKVLANKKQLSLHIFHKHADTRQEVKRTASGKKIVKMEEEDEEVLKKYIAMCCDMCSFVGDDNISIRKHFRAQHPDIKPYVRCCNKKLFNRIEMVEHAYKHDNPEWFKCTICQKVLSDRRRLDQHILDKHTPEEECEFQCDQCPKKFARQKTLEMHQNGHVPLEERKFVCDQCPNNSRFVTKSLLRVHINIAHSYRKVCHVCAKEMRDKLSFERHVRSHSEKAQPKVKCLIDDCDRWFKDEKYMRRHLVRHNVKNYLSLECDKCQRKYKDRESLKSHRRRVHPNVIYTCEECKKTFKRAICLKEHMTIHTGEILYKCPFCTCTFSNNSTLHIHTNKEHPVEWDNWRKTSNISLLHYSMQLQNARDEKT